MKEAVIIKSFHHGICMVLDEQADLEIIREEIGKKLQEARAFFKDASVALSLEGKRLTREEERKILETIYDNSDLKILCIVGNDEERDKLYLRAIRYSGKKLFEAGNGQFYKGSLMGREVLETDSGIVILGDVLKGCKIISKGNIVVLGSLYGEAYAGAAGDCGCQITALEMAPEKLRIGDFKYIPEGRRRFCCFSSGEYLPKTAYVKNRRILFEVLTDKMSETAGR